MVMAGTLVNMTMPLWVSGDESKPAPMPLLLVQSFVNTWDGDRNSDLLLDPATARDWLTEAGLWSAERAPDPAELHRARAVREGIRVMLAANSGGPATEPDDLEPLQAVARTQRPALQVDQNGRVTLDVDPADDPGAGLLALLLVIRDAQRDGTWPRLKACGNPDCRWAFYDRSHGQVGAWCDMATCGNRIKNRRLRQRPR
jgi:predicted RNA-binding Zn ribbon-like protein